MKKFYKYYYTANDIVSVEVSEDEFRRAAHGFTIDDEDLTDYSRTTLFELMYNHRISVEYFEYGVKEFIDIDGFKFEPNIIFSESIEKHPTFSAHMSNWSKSYIIKWNDDIKEYSIRVHSELPYNAGLLGLHTIYFVYLNYEDADWEKRCEYLWKIINSNIALFDGGGSQINMSNFKYGDFVEGIKLIYDNYVLVSRSCPFTKKFFNDNIKQALKIWDREHYRLFLCNNNFQID